MTRKIQSTVFAITFLILSSAYVLPVFGQGTPFNVPIAGDPSPDFLTVATFNTPVGSGPGRVTLIKFVTDATPASVQFQLEPLTTRPAVNFGTTTMTGEVLESDGITVVASAVFAQAQPDTVAAGHTMMLVTIQYASSYNFTVAETWRLKIAEQTAPHRYFGFYGSNTAEVTKGKLEVPSTMEFGNLFEGVAVNSAPIKSVEVLNVGTAPFTISGFPITSDPSPAFFNPVQATPVLLLNPGERLTNTISGTTPTAGLWVRARPTALGTRSSTMTLQTGAGGDTATVTLHAHGFSLYSHFVIDNSGSMSDTPEGGITTNERETRLWLAKQAAIKVTDWIQAFTDGQGYTGLSTFPGPGVPEGNTVIEQARSVANLGALNFRFGLRANGGLPGDGATTPMQQGIVAARNNMVNRLGTLGLNTTDRPNLFQAMLLLSDGAENSGSNSRLEISSLKDNGIKIYSAAYGLAGDINIPLLRALSEGDGANPGGTGGKFYVIDDPRQDFALKDAFKQSAADFLDLDTLVDPEGIIRRNQTRNHTVCVGNDVFGVTFSVDWNRNAAGAINFTLRDPQGATITPTSPNVSFLSNETHATYVIRGARVVGGQGAGQWTLQLTGSNSIPADADTRYSYSALAQSPHKTKVKFPAHLFTTDSYVFELDTGGIPPHFLSKPNIQVQYNTPVKSFGTFLATNPIKQEWVFDMRNINRTTVTAQPAAAGQIPSTLPSEPGQPMTIAGRKAAALAKFANKSFSNERKTQTFELFDDGTHGDKLARDGVYSSNATELRVAGSYKSVFGINTPPVGILGCYNRELTFARYIDVKLLPDFMVKNTTWNVIKDSTFFDPSVALAMSGSPKSGLTRRAVVFTPQDTIGNMWGPGRANEVQFKIAGGEPVGGVIDNWDGTYIQVVDFPSGTIPTATVTAAGVTSGPVPMPPQTQSPTLAKFSLGLRGGLAIPQGTTSSFLDVGGAFTADLEYHATNQLSAVGLFGYRRLSSSFPFFSGFNVFQFSAGGKAYLTSGQLRPFVNGGVGAFVFESGTTKFGTYGGGGVQYRAWQKVWLEGEYNFHSVFTSGSNFNFSTVQGGVRISF